MTQLKIIPLLWAIAGLTPMCITAQEPSSALAPIRKVWLDTDRLPENFGADSWSIVPKQQFETIHQRALSRQQAEKRPPWLTSAHYQARFENHQLHGTAELQIHNPHPLTAVAPLSPWVLPLAWQRKETGPGWLSLGERTLGIIAEPSTTSRHQLSWTLQGEERTEGTWFGLSLPGAATSTMDIIVPFPRRLDWPAARQHVSGPFDLPGSTNRRWRLNLGNAARHELQLVVRGTPGTIPSSWTEAKLDADFIVGEHELRVRYEYAIQRWQGRIGSVTMTMPARFQLSDITLRQNGTDVPVTWQALAIPDTLQVNLPETIEQRATIIVKGIMARALGKRTPFLIPLLHGALSIQPTLRIVSHPNQPWKDWQWGDYQPQHAPEADPQNESAAEIITLTQRGITEGTFSRPPSALIAERQLELGYMQDTWWHLDDARQTMTVRCQFTIHSGEIEVLSWTIPQGWNVKEVGCTPVAELRHWACQADDRLHLEAKTVWRAGRTYTAIIKLEAKQPPLVAALPVRMKIPHLTPQMPGRFSGTYAMTLGRRKNLQTPGLTVASLPGPWSIPPDDREGLWIGQANCPDAHWSLHQLAPGGEVIVQGWKECARVLARTSLLERNRETVVRYELTIHPVAGFLHELRVWFSEPIGNVVWQSPSSVPLTWQADQKSQGLLRWQNPLQETLTAVCEVPWNKMEALPLIDAEFCTQRLLSLPIEVKVEPGSQVEIKLPVQKSTENVYEYTAHMPSLRLQRQLLPTLQRSNEKLVSKIVGSFAEHDYRAHVSCPHRRIQFKLPPAAEVICITINGQTVEPAGDIDVDTWEASVDLRVKYRTQVASSFGAQWLEHPLPQWREGDTAQPIAQTFETNLVPWPGNSLVRTHSTVVCAKAGYFFSRTWWIQREQLHYAGFFMMALLLLTSKHLSRLFVGLVLLALAVSSWCLPTDWLALPTWICLGLIPRAFTKNTLLCRRTLAPAAVAVMLPCLIWGQTDHKPVIIYVLPKANGALDDQAVIPTAYWGEVQRLAQQTIAGIKSPYVVESVDCRGEVTNQKIKFSAKWVVHLLGAQTVELPWSGPAVLQEAWWDEKPIQPRLNTGPFGLRTLSLRLAGTGKHTLQLNWEAPVQRFGALNRVSILLPGAPVQELEVRLSGAVPSLQLLGSPGKQSLFTQGPVSRVLADVGFSRKVSLTWSDAPAKLAQPEVRVGMLWEHHVHQSIAHAILEVQASAGSLDHLKLHVPQGLVLRQVTVLGNFETSAPPRLSQWTYDADSTGRIVRLHFQRPIEGKCYILLELPWDRSRSAGFVPLACVRPLGVRTVEGFVAYLLDGVEARPLGRLEPVPEGSYDFAKPWLSSLGALPASQFSRWPSESGDPIKLQLSPVEKNTEFDQRISVTLLPDSAIYKNALTVKAGAHPPVFLSADVPRGVSIEDIQGADVLRWCVIQPETTMPSRLEIWLKRKPTANETTRLVINIKQPLAGNSSGTIQIPLRLLKWDGNNQIGQIELRTVTDLHVQALGWKQLRPCVGPGKDRETLGLFWLERVQTENAAFEVKIKPVLQKPHVSVQETPTAQGKIWSMTIQSTGGEGLPPHLELAARNIDLNDEWSLEADVPIAYTVSPHQGDALQWSIQASAAWSKLILRKRINSAGSRAPVVTSPQLKSNFSGEIRD